MLDLSIDGLRSENHACVRILLLLVFVNVLKIDVIIVNTVCIVYFLEGLFTYLDSVC
jgi:hypothetical protein